MDARRPQQGQVFNLQPDGIDDGRIDLVAALACGFDHDVEGAVDDIGVVPGAAGHAVIAGAAVQRIGPGQADQGIVADAAENRVVATIAGHHVFQRVADCGDVAIAGQDHVFNPIGQFKVDRPAHGVDAACDGFDDLVLDVVDVIGVVAVPSGHAVIAGAAVQRVIAKATDDGVIACIAHQIVVAGVAGQAVGDVGAGAVQVAKA